MYKLQGPPCPSKDKERNEKGSIKRSDKDKQPNHNKKQEKYMKI